MNNTTRQACDTIIASMTQQNITLEDLLIHSLLTRKEQLLELVKTFPEDPQYSAELKEVRSQLLAFGE